ncbi:hypothetical protein [Oleiagrimonas sp. C23AA]|uniref:hypothetical protein n=1 Tax=Oleiagrimonas sp. C23AA TaxID=2719047 RepID=UPI00142373A3|nr:hypothetical protein [Oleiagrimonas sp. C23AA]NII09170.1 hypothetical protein [Oleiagrimonas sp. C23AA]
MMHPYDDTPPPSVEAAVKAYVDALLWEEPQPAASPVLDCPESQSSLLQAPEGESACSVSGDASALTAFDPAQTQPLNLIPAWQMPEQMPEPGEPVLGTFGPSPELVESHSQAPPPESARVGMEYESADMDITQIDGIAGTGSHAAGTDSLSEDEPAPPEAWTAEDFAPVMRERIEPDSSRADSVDINRIMESAVPLPDGVTEYRICRISTVRVAIPLDRLHSIEQTSPAVHFSGIAWELGRHREGDHEWTVIDLARVVAPGVPRAGPEHLLTIAGTKWALACTLEDTPMRLRDDQIRWRDGTGLRPWLVGMTYEHKCAIIDLDKLIEQLTTDPRLA